MKTRLNIVKFKDPEAVQIYLKILLNILDNENK